jgi:hypothetical protein
MGLGMGLGTDVGWAGAWAVDGHGMVVRGVRRAGGGSGWCRVLCSVVVETESKNTYFLSVVSGQSGCSSQCP